MRAIARSALDREELSKEKQVGWIDGRKKEMRYEVRNEVRKKVKEGMKERKKRRESNKGRKRRREGRGICLRRYMKRLDDIGIESQKIVMA